MDCRTLLLPACLAVASLVPVACYVEPIEPADVPVVRIQTTGGFEHGVTTDLGVLFLGRTASAGPAKFLYWLGPTPMIETGTIEAIGGGVHRVVTEVAIPTIPISLEPVVAGEPLVLMGIRGQEPWTLPVELANDDVITGSVLRYPSGLELTGDSVGLGVFRKTEAGHALVGLVKGVAVKDDGERFLLFAGLTELRDAFARAGKAIPDREVEYRADGHRILRYRH